MPRDRHVEVMIRIDDAGGVQCRLVAEELEGVAATMDEAASKLGAAIHARAEAERRTRQQ